MSTRQFSAAYAVETSRSDEQQRCFTLVPQLYNARSCQLAKVPGFAATTRARVSPSFNLYLVAVALIS